MEIETILRNHGLRNTAFRKELLGMFYDTESSLSVEEIRSQISISKDKVTVYRALEGFENCGLIHRVPDKNNLIRFALCQSCCTPKHHEHNHAHLICSSCDKTFCIDDIKIPKVNNTIGFEIKSSKLILEGYCADCISVTNGSKP